MNYWIKLSLVCFTQSAVALQALFRCPSQFHRGLAKIYGVALALIGAVPQLWLLFSFLFLGRAVGEDVLGDIFAFAGL